MNDNTENVKMKVCTGCAKELVASNDNFGKETKGKYGLLSKCKPCMKELRQSQAKQKYDYDRKRYAEKREEILAYNKLYMAGRKDIKSEYDKNRREGADREKILQKKKEYAHRVKDKFKEQWIAYRKRTAEAKRLYDINYYQENKERVRKVCTNWRQNNRDKDTVSKQRYKARRKKLDSTFTEEQWIQCKHAFDNRCAYCRKIRKLTQEHFVPVTKSGEYTLNNIVPSCQSCNSSKGKKEFSMWYRSMDFYSAKQEKKILNYLRYENNTQQLALL